MKHGRVYIQAVRGGSSLKVDERGERLAVQMVRTRPELWASILLHRESPDHRKLMSLMNVILLIDTTLVDVILKLSIVKFQSKDKMKRGSRRGCIRLKRAIIGIDDEDDCTFTIRVDNRIFHFQGFT